MGIQPSLLILAAALACTGRDSTATSAIAQIAICEDENEWPPYVYRQRGADGASGKLTGYAVDVISEILKQHGIRVSFELIPWPRCQAVAALGQQFQMVLNLSYNEERMRNFLMTRAYYSTTTYYYYSRRHYPKGPPVHSPADLRRHRVCGIHGYNYVNYGLPAGTVDQGARDFESLIAKLHASRCVLFLEKHEVMAGFAAIGKNYLADRDLVGAPMPGMPKTAFYMGVSRRYKHAHELRALVDDALLKMQENGRLAEIWRRYAKSPPANMPGGLL
ncbi:substrate-binding periplasmic protein [Pseudoduganella sp. OTU4001]|uniref:substrate-binding periplasmic protein n=1 Tax=Pseudoduganella sp. OTU4001 TaxID=3043854 RepID=UPI00313D5694